MTSGTLVIWSLSRLDNGTRMPCPDGFDWSGAPVWTASGMGHWKRLIEIAGGTDCYYWINNMTCLWINNMTCPIYVFYCLVVLVTVPDHLAAISILCYFTWYILHFLWWHTTHGYVYSALHIFCFPYTLQTSLLSMHSTVLWLSCTCPSACSLLSRHH